MKNEQLINANSRPVWKEQWCARRDAVESSGGVEGQPFMVRGHTKSFRPAAQPIPRAAQVTTSSRRSRLSQLAPPPIDTSPPPQKHKRVGLEHAEFSQNQDLSSGRRSRERVRSTGTQSRSVSRTKRANHSVTPYTKEPAGVRRLQSQSRSRSRSQSRQSPYPPSHPPFDAHISLMYGSSNPHLHQHQGISSSPSPYPPPLPFHPSLYNNHYNYDGDAQFSYSCSPSPVSLLSASPMSSNSDLMNPPLSSAYMGNRYYSESPATSAPSSASSSYFDTMAPLIPQPTGSSASSGYASSYEASLPYASPSMMQYPMSDTDSSILTYHPAPSCLGIDDEPPPPPPLHSHHFATQQQQQQQQQQPFNGYFPNSTSSPDPASQMMLLAEQHRAMAYRQMGSSFDPQSSGNPHLLSNSFLTDHVDNSLEDPSTMYYSNDLDDDYGIFDFEV